MVGNLHSIGAMLQDSISQKAAGHTVRIKTSQKTSEPIVATAPPIGQKLEAEFGLDFAAQNRVFRVLASDLEAQGLGEPKLNWKIIDESDGTVWSVLPQGNDYGWSWFGQHRTRYQLLTKQDK